MYDDKLNRELLTYGTFITDDDYCTLKTEFIRIRIISYKGKLYYHKMIDGDVIEIKEIGYNSAIK